MKTPAPRRRGFTVIELIVAGMIAVLVLSAVTFSLSQLGRSRNVVLARLESSMRARAALEAVRRDIAGVIRDADLLKCRVLVTDGTAPTAAGTVDRDELLLFSTKLQSTREVAYSGEGIEYETQYRIIEDDAGPVLWQRRDFVPDGYADAGGVAVPVVEGIIGFSVEAYDGLGWFEEWDSDLDGLPWALRITVTALPGDADLADPDPTGMVTLRTLVPIDRIVPPPQEVEDPEGEGDKPEDEGGAVDEDGNPIVGGDGGVDENGNPIAPTGGGRGGADDGMGGSGGRGEGGFRPFGGGGAISGGGGGAAGAGGGGGGRGGPAAPRGPGFTATPGFVPGASIGRGSRTSRTSGGRSSG